MRTEERKECRRKSREYILDFSVSVASSAKLYLFVTQSFPKHTVVLDSCCMTVHSTMAWIPPLYDKINTQKREKKKKRVKKRREIK